MTTVPSARRVRTRRPAGSAGFHPGDPADRKARVVIYAMLVMGAVVFVVPFLWMVSTALKSSTEVFAFPPRLLPKDFQWRNFADGWDVLPFTRFLGNTVLVVVGAMVGNMISCILPAYAFARMRGRGKNIAFALMLATMAIPIEVTLVPTFILFSKLHLVNTLWPLVLPAWFGYAYFIFLLRQFFLTLPQEYDEAARIDGAGYLRTLWYVVIPQAKPAIATIAVFSFVGNWNNLLAPLIYLRTQDKFTLAVGLQLFQGQFTQQYNQMMAVSLITILPIMVVFFLAQRTFLGSAGLTGLGGR